MSIADFPRRYDHPTDFSRLVEYHRSAWAASGLTGNWQVGDLNYITWENTTFASRENHPFFVWQDADGSIIAFALVSHFLGAFQPRCHPRLRTKHTVSPSLSQLVAWCERELLERESAKATIKVHGVDSNDGPYIELLQARGYHGEAEAGCGYILEHPLGALAPALVPAGYLIRRIDEEDIDRRAALAREVWDGWGMWGDAKVTALQYKDFTLTGFYSAGLDLVAVSSVDRFAAAVTCGVDREGHAGTVMDLGTAPDHQRRG